MRFIIRTLARYRAAQCCSAPGSPSGGTSRWRHPAGAWPARRRCPPQAHVHIEIRAQTQRVEGDPRPFLRRQVRRDKIRVRRRGHAAGRQSRSVGEEAIQHHRQTAGGRPEDHPGHTHQIKTAHLRQHVQPVRRVRLVMSDRLAHHRHLMAPLRQRQIGPAAHHRVGVAAGQDADRRSGRGGIGHPQLPTPKTFTPSAASWRAKRMLASSTVSAC